MNTQTMKNRAAVALTCSLMLSSLVLVGLSAPSVASSLNPAQTIALARHDALAGKWVHETTTLVQGQLTLNSVDDIGTIEGRQVVGENNGAISTLIAFDATRKMYEKANAQGVTPLLGIPAAHAAAYTNKWLLVTPIDSNYASVAQSTTLASSFATLLSIPGSPKFGATTTIAGVRVRTITGTIPATPTAPVTTVTLYVTASGKVLPIQLRENSTTFSLIATWSKWGTPVRLVAPAGATAFPRP